MAFLLGLDIGTGKTACVIVDSAKGTLLHCSSVAHHAAIEPGIQDPAIHLRVVRDLLLGIPQELAENVSAVGVTGQMHGAVLWNETETSPLYTWQYIVPDLEEIRKTAPELRHGFGIATLASLARSGHLAKYTRSATIYDYVVWHLTGCSKRVFTDYTGGASWGAYDLTENKFKLDLIQALHIPISILPEVVRPCHRAGHIVSGWGLPGGIPVMVATGDNQASVFSASRDAASELHLTLGTGAQLSAITEHIGTSGEYRPYPGGRYLAVGSPLCGGASWALIASFYREILVSLTGTAPEGPELYDRIDALALAELEKDGLPEVAPHFLGERYAPELRGSITNIDPGNFTPGKIAAAFALGIVRNLQQSLSAELTKGRTKLLCSGNAVRKTKVLQKACRMVFDLTPEFPEGKEEAACGAARMAEELLE